MKRKRLIAVFLALVVLYMVGYLFLRSDHWLVHSVVRNHDYTYLDHSVRGGDRGIIGCYIAECASIAYTPLRLIERGYWHWHHPVGTSLSPADRNRLPQ